jgi:hypothetical protein
MRQAVGLQGPTDPADFGGHSIDVDLLAPTAGEAIDCSPS